MQKQFNIRPGFLLRDAPGVTGREVNFQAVRDTEEFYQDSCVIMSAVVCCSSIPYIYSVVKLFSTVKRLCRSSDKVFLLKES